MATRTNSEVQAALAAIEGEHASLDEKVEMLMEIAMGLQTRPKTVSDIQSALLLYAEAERLCPSDDPLLRARIEARCGTAHQAIPSENAKSLEAALACFEKAAPILKELGSVEEVAELEMNLGLVLQSLVGHNRARITDAIAAYQRALRTFNKEKHPKEFAILQNNLATAFLSIPFTDERSKMREALAVQSFEEGLKVVDIIDHPIEYAMLQNNLGNALQYASSSHALENNLRALEAYDEALRVRTRATTPLEYANTISNKANCLWNLPIDAAEPESDVANNIKLARALYQEAHDIFGEHGEFQKALIIKDALEQIAVDLDGRSTSRSNGKLQNSIG